MWGPMNTPTLSFSVSRLGNFSHKNENAEGNARKCMPFKEMFMRPNLISRVRSNIVHGRGVHRVLVGKPEGKRPLGRRRRRWEDNIKMDLQEAGWGFGDWMELAQDRERWRVLVGTVRNFRVPKMRGIS